MGGCNRFKIKHRQTQKMFSDNEESEILVQDKEKVDLNPYKSAKWNTARADANEDTDIAIAAHYAKITLKIFFAVFVMILNLR